MQKNILLIGSGGREHALAWKIKQSPFCGKLYIAPGNAGTLECGENVSIDATDIDSQISFAKENDINLVIVAPDDPLALGAVDAFKEVGINAWGPTKAAARIEASKAFAKELMQKQNIPTAKFKSFTDYGLAQKYLEEIGAPVVVKASGLALGKGAVVCKTLDEALDALSEMMLEKKFGEAGSEVVIEEFMEGAEVSIHAFSDGKSHQLFPSSQDHKQIYDGDSGPNTGGMGAFAPVPFVSPEDIKIISKSIVSPILEGLQNENSEFVGCLYPGLMKTKEGYKVVEFNCRFGDPETEVYMRLLKTDLIEIILKSLEKKLNEISVEWKDEYAVSVVLASGGYPEKYERGFLITGIEEAEKIPGIKVFHAGTKLENGSIVTNGGRVLNVTAVGNTLKEAIDKAYIGVGKINFQNMYYRKDIGKKGL